MAKNKMSGEEFYRRVRVSPREREKVFQELHFLHYRELTGRFLVRQISRGESEEYASEVFLRLWRYCESLDGDTPPDHYMNRIASRLIADHFKKLGTWQPNASQREDTPEAGTDDTTAADEARPSPGQLTADVPDEANDAERFDADESFRVASICAKRAWAAFQADHPEDAEILMTYTLERMSAEELQALTGSVSPGAAREKLSQIRKKREKYCLQYCETPDCS